MIRLGKTEMMVSKLGFGGIHIQRIAEDEAVAVVKRCLDLGITFIDTTAIRLSDAHFSGPPVAPTSHCRPQGKL